MNRQADLSDLLDAPAGRQLAVLRDRGLDDVNGLSWLLDRAAELLHDAPRSSIVLCEVSIAAAEPAQLHTVLARACYLRARMCGERGEFPAALELIDRARLHWLSAGALTQALRTDLGRMSVLDDLGRHDEAARVGEAVIAALDAGNGGGDGDGDEAELRRWLRAAAQENIGVAFGFVGQHDRALAAYTEAERAYDALEMGADSLRARANRGVELLELGRAAEALTVLRAAAGAFTAAHDRLWSAKCNGFVAQALQQLGRLVDALRVAEPARATLDELEAEAEAVRLQIATAGIYLSAGLSGEARGEARIAARRADGGGMRHDAAAAHLLIGLSYLADQRLDEAAEALDRAATGFDEAGDAQQLARVRLAQSDVASGRGDTAAATALAERAAGALEAGGWAAPLAWALLRRHDLAPARNGALDEAVRLSETLQLPRLREAAALRLARRHRRRGEAAEAERLLRTLVEGTGSGAVDPPDHVSHARFDPDRRTAYDELIDLVLARDAPGATDEAWRISHRATGRMLIDLTAATLGSPTGEEPVRVRALLDETYTALQDAAPDERDSLRRRADEMERRISVLRLRSAVTEPPPAGPDAASAVIRPAEGQTVAYHVLGIDVLAFVATPDTTRVVRLTGAVPAIEDCMRQLAAQWMRFRLPGGFLQRNARLLEQTTIAILGALDSLLLAPLRGNGLLERADGSALHIVPDGPLHHVPFQALHDGTGYLVERHVVTIVPTCATAVERAPRATGTPLVLAVPDVHAPSVAAEAEALRAIVPAARVLVGAEATTEALAAFPAPPDLLHIACHGLYRPTNPLFSAMRLADRWLAAVDVLDLNLDGSLVTLSSCESGLRGALTVDPVGLAWAFLAAGARGVVVSQWVVHDDATAELMAAFYRELVAGRDTAAALRTAQLATSARHSHPFFWAPFTFVASPHRSAPGAPHVAPP
jgi:tetratricopeptide (TPR) repeat protein